MPPPIFEPLHFEQEDRARLWFKVADLLPNEPDKFAHLNERGMYWLEDSLKRVLGRLILAKGHTEQQRIQALIMSAPERDILKLIEIVPLARQVAHSEFNQDHRYSHDTGHFDEQEACDELNSFLETTSSPARFNKDGAFIHEPFAPDVPVALSKLPGKEQLRSDLKLKCVEEIPTALVFVDLDNFKQVNDKLGHLAGDDCLSKVVDVLGKIAAMRGKVYRYGGDEFVVVLPNCTTDEASPVAERIRREIEAANVGGEVKVTASIGVASTDRTGNDAEDLISSADTAMYNSKRDSRNKVTQYQG
jgi:diguanylate cyclase (GGDEF)-like protein